MTRWFRLYDEILDDPKVQKLSAEAFRAWINLLCLACRNGGSFLRADVPFALRTSALRAEALLTTLVSAGLMEYAGVSVVPHNWTERQYISDSSATRVKRHRERHRNVTCNVTTPLHETAPDTETESDTEKIPPVAPLAGGAASNGHTDGRKRGTRLPTDWDLPAWAAGFAGEIGLPPDRLHGEAAKFCDHWRSSTRNATKLDWDAAFRNWLRRAAEGGAGAGNGGHRPRHDLAKAASIGVALHRAQFGDGSD